MQKLRGRPTGISTLAFSPDQPLLAATGVYGDLHVWDTSTGQLVCELDVATRYFSPSPLVFLPAGVIFMPCDGGWAHIDMAKATVNKHHVRANHVAVATNAEGRYAVVCGHARDFRVYDLAKSNRLLWEHPANGPTTIPYKPALAVDSRRVIAHELAQATAEPPGDGLWARRLSDGTVLGHWPVDNVQLQHLEITTDGQRLAAMTTRSVLWWNLAQPGSKPQKVVNPGRQHLAAMAVYPTGEKFATIANDRYVRVWATGTLQLETTLEWNIGKLHAIAFSPDGLRAAVGSGRGTVLVWDVE